MTERQELARGVAAATTSAGGATRHTVRVESIDGEVVQIEARSTDTVGAVCAASLGNLNLLAPDPDKYFLLDAGNRVVDPDMTIDQVLAENRELSFQLIPQAEFGPPGCEVAPCPILC